MKAKTIKQVLRAKINDWAATIEDEALRKQVLTDAIVTGGAIASMLLREPVNDYDVYFRTHATTLAVAKYYIARFQPQKKHGIACAISVLDESERIKIVIKSAGIASADGTEKAYEYFESRPEGEAGNYVNELMLNPGEIEETYQAEEEKAQAVKCEYKPVFASTNAITLGDKIQVVLRFFGEPDAIHENYDFVHCTNYWTSHDNNLVLRPAALEALLARELRYVGSKYPVCSIIRLRKFIQRKWTVNAGQILKMIMQINELNLTDIAVLQDQLTGVDCAYFAEVMGKLKDKDPTKVNAAYLIEIIDRMF